MSVSTSPAKQPVTREIYYPETDGEPMAETDLHRDLMIDLISALDVHFKDDPEVYVSGDLLIYYVEGDRTKRVAPDVFVVRGVPKHRRRIYKLWEEARAPEVVIEVSSRGTIRNDTQKKAPLYARWGVREYYLFDPEYDWLPDGLAAHRLDDGIYEDMEIKDGVVHSAALGLDLVDTGATLRLRDPRTGQFLPTLLEAVEARQQAEAARQEAEARANAADAEAARLREELARLRAQS